MESPGWKTSEFWLSVLGALIGFALCFHSKESMNEYGIMLLNTCIVGYTISRGVAKMRPRNPPSTREGVQTPPIRSDGNEN